MDTYLKEIEKSVHDLQNFHPHFPVTNFKANLQSMNTHLHEQFNKFIAPKSKLPMVVFLASAMICFLGSALFHTFGCQSQRAFYFFLKLDYSGIAVLIAGSIVPFICYIFHELTVWQYVYLSLLSVVSLLVMMVSFLDRFSDEKYQPYRAALFVIMACFFVVPFAHMLIVYGNVDANTFARFVLSAALYIMGVVSYVLRCPERLYPGKFNIWLHSHQVFHMFIVAAAFVWYTFMKRLFEGTHSHVALL
jgi:adiponectin receptor